MATPFSKYYNIRRAHSVDEKDRCVHSIAEEWKRMPQMRLGQLLECVVKVEGVDLFAIEDGPLVDSIERFVEQFTKKAGE